MPRSRLLRLVLPVAIVLVLALVFLPSAPPPADAPIFTVGRNATSGEIRAKAAGQEFSKGHPLLGLAMLLHGGYGRVDPGGYRIDPAMGSWRIAGILTGPPQLLWLTIPEGLRKEQVAKRVGDALDWNDEQRARFLLVDSPPYDLTDGFFFPDTYLIPLDEEPEKVTRRFVNRFTENFDPLLPAYREGNIKYDTAVKLASILQREAAGTHDMPLIAGILWNRLLIKMKLEVDATLQYARGDAGDGWWAAVSRADKENDSPYNTYKYAGLPPGPIANPGLAALKAVAAPEETECLFYLHAPDKSIHCSVDYAGHLENIETYLRGS